MQEPEENLIDPAETPAAQAETPAPETGASPFEPEAPAPAAAPTQRPPAPFWRRLAAFAVDYILLAMLFLLPSFVLADQYMQAGPWGRLIGGLTGVLYFAAGASPLGRGRTIGKRLFRIVMRRVDGSPLPFDRALLRALLLMTPLTLNGMQVGVIGPVTAVLLSAVVFGGNLALVYFFLFNRPSRRSLHDLLAGSVVLYDDSAVPDTAFRRKHAIALVIALAALAGGMAAFAYLLRQRLDITAMQHLQTQIGRLTDTPAVGVTEGAIITNGRRRTWVAISATTYEEVDNREEITRAIVVLTLRTLRSANDVDQISVTFRYGYDMLFCSGWASHTESHSVTEWRQMIDASDAAQ